MRFFRIIVAALCLALPTSGPAWALGSVTVLADGHLGVALTQIARRYSRDNNVIVNLSFASTEQQGRQIDEGAAADVLITPRQGWIDEMKTRGLLDISSQVDFAADRLALVAPAGSMLGAEINNRFPVAEIIRAIDYEPLFVMPHPETLPEGAAAKESMRGVDAADYMEPYTVYLKTLPEMLEMVSLRQGYGVFLYSSVRYRDEVKVLDLFPESSHRAFMYHAVAIAGDNMDAARKFIDYLDSPRAQAILEEHALLP